MAAKTTEHPSAPEGILASEMRTLIDDLKTLRGEMNVSLRMYPLRQPTLGAWQERLDSAIARAEQLLQEA